MAKQIKEKAVPMITRTFNTHTIKADKLLNDEKGNLIKQPIEPIIVECESMDTAKALITIAEKYGKDGNYFVNSITTVSKKIGMTVSDFLIHGKEIVDKKEK